MKLTDLKPGFKKSFPHLADFMPGIPLQQLEKSGEVYTCKTLLRLDLYEVLQGWYAGDKDCLKLLLLFDRVIAELNNHLTRKSAVMLKTAMVSCLNSGGREIVQFIGQLTAVNYALVNDPCTLEVLVAPNQNGSDYEFILAYKDEPIKKLVTVTNLFFSQEDLQSTGKLEKKLSSSAKNYPYKVGGLESILQQRNVLVLWSFASLARQLHTAIRGLPSNGPVSSYDWILSSVVLVFPDIPPVIKFGAFKSILNTESSGLLENC